MEGKEDCLYLPIFKRSLSNCHEASILPLFVVALIFVVPFIFWRLGTDIVQKYGF